MALISRPLRRVEDTALLRGEATYLDDIVLPRMLAVAFLRSDHAHARLRRVDVSRARQQSGVVAALTGEDAYRVRAEQLLEVFSGEARRNPAVHAALLSGYGMLAEAVQVVVMGASDDPALAALWATALGAAAPDPILLTVTPGATLGDYHPAAGKGLIDDRATAYVCVGRTCLPPVTAPERLAELLTPARLRSLR